MSVEIDPVELGFQRKYIPGCTRFPSNCTQGPFTTEVAQILKIRNPNQTPVAFKVCPHNISKVKILGSNVAMNRSRPLHQNSMALELPLAPFAKRYLYWPHLQILCSSKFWSCWAWKRGWSHRYVPIPCYNISMLINPTSSPTGYETRTPLGRKV